MSFGSIKLRRSTQIYRGKEFIAKSIVATKTRHRKFLTGATRRLRQTIGLDAHILIQLIWEKIHHLMSYLCLGRKMSPLQPIFMGLKSDHTLMGILYHGFLEKEEELDSCPMSRSTSMYWVILKEISSTGSMTLLLNLWRWMFTQIINCQDLCGTMTMQWPAQGLTWRKDSMACTFWGITRKKTPYQRENMKLSFYSILIVSKWPSAKGRPSTLMPGIGSESSTATSESTMRN